MNTNHQSSIPDHELPSISLIIPCRNEENYIKDCLTSVLNGTYPQDKLEILVIDGLSTDKTREIVLQLCDHFPQIKLFNNPKKIIPASMNIGIAESSNDIILKIDAHAMYSSIYVRQCVEELILSDADNVGGIIETIPRDSTIIGKSIVTSLSHKFGVGPSLFRVGTKEKIYTDTAFSGCYRKKTLLEVGGYDEDIARSEDVTVNSKIIKRGGKILLNPEICTKYFARSTIHEFWKHNLNNGFWSIYPFRKGYVHISLRHLIPLFFVLSLLLLGIMSILYRESEPWNYIFWSLLALDITSYLFVNFISSLGIALQKRNFKYIISMPFIFSILHIGYGLGSIQGFWKAFVVHPLKDLFHKKTTEEFQSLSENIKVKYPENPFVSLIIPCRNEIECIVECLESVANNDYPKQYMELIIIDGMSDDGTRECIKDFVQKYPWIKPLDNPGKEQQLALNIGIQNAKGDIIIRMDAHTLYDNHYISECVKGLVNYGADNVGGRWVIEPRSDRMMSHAICAATSCSFGVGNAYYRLNRLSRKEPVAQKPIWDINVGYLCCRKEIFDQIGLFNENLNRSEDIDFLKRLKQAGYRTLYIPSIISRYKMRTNFLQFVRHMFKNGLWVVLPLEHAPRLSFNIRHIVPFLFVISYLTCAILSLFEPKALWLLLFILGSYLTVNFYYSLRLALRDHKGAYLFILPFVFFCLHSFYGMGSIVGFSKLFYTKLKKLFKRNTLSNAY